MPLTFIHTPRKTMLRRVFFQLHLWLGLFIALYVVVIGLSGSTLVFQEEIRRASLPHKSYDPEHLATITHVVDLAHAANPFERLTFIAPPQEPNPWWTLYSEDASGKTHTTYADAESGQHYSLQHRVWIDWVQDLHVSLLAGHSGFVVNCTMGVLLLIVALTGIVLWWRGLRNWTHGLTISFHKGWKRFNYDLHCAVGFWTLAIVCWWGLTAIYFLFPVQVSSLVNQVSPLVGMKPPQALPTSKNNSVASLEALLKENTDIKSGSVSGVSLPASPGDNITIYVDRRNPGDFSHRDIRTFDGHTGRLLSCWHYGENQSIGDWLLWLVYPLHFGTLWGLPIKILWSCFGLCLVGLSISGVWMYWNRWLSKRL